MRKGKNEKEVQVDGLGGAVLLYHQHYSYQQPEIPLFL